MEVERELAAEDAEAMEGVFSHAGGGFDPTGAMREEERTLTVDSEGVVKKEPQTDVEKKKLAQLEADVATLKASLRTTLVKYQGMKTSTMIIQTNANEKEDQTMLQVFHTYLVKNLAKLSKLISALDKMIAAPKSSCRER